MILNNYWEMRRFQQLYYIRTADVSPAPTAMKHLDTGANISVYYGVINGGALYQMYSQSFNLVSNTSVRVGSSTETGDIFDYALKEPISSGITISDLNWNITTQNSSKRILTFNVAASTDVDINEVGIVKSFPADYQGKTMQPVLLVRVVLEDTVSLHSGESTSITIEWDEA